MKKSREDALEFALMVALACCSTLDDEKYIRPSRPFHIHMQKARREIRKEFPKPKRKKRAT